MVWLFFFSGLQEYIEAVSFQYFIKTRSLISVEEINKQLIFTAEDREETTNMVKAFLFSYDISFWNGNATTELSHAFGI